MTRHQAHPSEQVVGRIRKDHGWDRRFGSRSQPVQYSPDGPSLAELVVGVLVLLTWFVAAFWALPVIFTAVTQ